MTKKRGCCEERQSEDEEESVENSAMKLTTAPQPAPPVHQSLVFANALRDPCKKGALRLIDPRGCIMSDDNKTVTRKPQRTHCFVVEQTPLKLHPGKGWFFEIEIDGVREGKIGGLGIGVTTASSSKLAKLDWCARAVPESWIVGYWGQVSSCGQQLRIGWKPEDLVVGDRVGFLISPVGSCHVFVNKRERVLIENLIPTKNINQFWALVDIFSCTSSVRFLEDCIPPKRIPSGPQDKLSVKPVGTPGQSQGSGQKVAAEVQPEASRQDLKDKLAKKLAGKASVRGKKQPVKGKQKDPVEILKEKAAAEKSFAPPGTTKAESEQSLVQPVKGLTMYQTCILARLAAEKRLRIHAKAGSENDSITKATKQDDNVEMTIPFENKCEPKSVQSSSRVKKATPRRKTAPSSTGTSTAKSRHRNLQRKDVPCNTPEDFEDTEVKKVEDPIQNCSIEDDPVEHCCTEAVEDAEFADELSCARRDKVTGAKHECNQDVDCEEKTESFSIQAIAPAENDVKITYAKKAEVQSDRCQEKEEEASSSGQPEEEPQIASSEASDATLPLPLARALRSTSSASSAEVEPAPEASPVPSCTPCSFDRAASPLWVVPGVPRRCGMFGYLAVNCMGQTLYSDDDRVDVVCTEGCVAVFHASCYKSFRRPPDRSCLDTTCSGKLCRIWKTGSIGDVTVVFDLKQEQESSVQAPSKSSSSTAVDKPAEKTAKPADSQDKSAKSTDLQDKVYCGFGQTSQRVTVAGSSPATQRPKVASTKKKQDAIPTAQTAARECLRSTLGKASADSNDEISQVKESFCVRAKLANTGGFVSEAEASLRPAAGSEPSSSSRGIPNASELQAAARRCNTGDFMVLAPWSSEQRWGDQESLTVEKGGVVYVSRVDQQGWALATCRHTQNNGWLPSDFLCRCIYTAKHSFSNGIGGYSVIAKGELVSVFHREGCWIYGASLANPHVQINSFAGAEEWKQIGWYPADIIVP